MTTLQQACAAIRPVDPMLIQAARQQWDLIAKPLGSLGLLEENVARMCAAAGSLSYRPDQKALGVFCADNGVVVEGVTQVGSEVTATVAANLCNGQTSVCNMARVTSCRVIPVDMGMNRSIADDRILCRRVANGTKNMAHEPAMTREEAVRAIEVGIGLACQLHQEGYTLLATGEMGIGNTTSSSAVASVLLQEPVEAMTGVGSGLSREGLGRKIAVIKASIAKHQPSPDDAIDVLAKVGGFDIAGMTGMFLGAALCQVPCVIDGLISSVSALIAVRLCPASAGYMVASHQSVEPAGGKVLKALGLSPMITAGMRLGEGTGAVAAMPLLDMGFAVFDGMCTFEEAKIPAYSPLC